ncbi:thioredoxin domain-containing protein [Planctomicrobium sp. SH664]|uniref:thioredoxin domain-containing protein n=1 Tax=Planctomicrobium sp. SH664 TaxID=3448125 RepID=UPI003F5B6922
MLPHLLLRRLLWISALVVVCIGTGPTTIAAGPTAEVPASSDEVMMSHLRPIPPGVPVSRNSDPVFEQGIAALAAALNQQLNSFGEGHPSVVGLRQQLLSMIELAMQNQIQADRSKIQSARQRLDDLEKALNHREKNIAALAQARLKELCPLQPAPPPSPYLPTRLNVGSTIPDVLLADGIIVWIAKWSAPCQRMLPTLEKLKKEGVAIHVIDIDDVSHVQSATIIDVIPTICRVRGHVVTEMATGYVTEERLRQIDLWRIPVDPPASPAASFVTPSVSPKDPPELIPQPAPSPIQQPDIAPAVVAPLLTGGDDFQLELAQSQTAKQPPIKRELLSYVDDSAESKRSIAGSGHAVKFDRTGLPGTVEAVEIFSSRYGYPQAPKEDFKIWLLDEEKKVIKEIAVPYAKIPRESNLNWRSLTIPLVEVPDIFYVAVAFNPEQTKGVYVGIDEGVQETHSYTGIATEGLEEYTGKGDWMIRVRLTDRKPAKGTTRLQ